MRRSTLFVSLLLAASCSRDLTLPPPPGPTPPGTIYGRVVYSQPGSSVLLPAAGASVELLSTSIATSTDDDGRFSLDGIVQTDGALLIRFGVQADGSFQRQRLISLAKIGAGPGHDISLGELAISENAQIRGRVVRGNISTPTGHGGTTIFVPEGPFTTQSGDDGTFILANVPEGSLRLVFFRPGYRATSLDDVTVRAGEDLQLKPVTLELDPQPAAPGTLNGNLAFQPATEDGSAATIEANDYVDPIVSVTADAAGAFKFNELPPAVYTLTARCPGYSPVVIPNFFVGSGGQYVLANVTLTAATSSGAGGGGGAGAGGGAGGGTGGGGGTSVFNGNLPPVVDPGLPRAVRTGTIGVQLDGSASRDPEGKPLHYTWSNDAGTAGTDGLLAFIPNDSLVASAPKFNAPPVPTQLQIFLTVTDPEGLSDTKSLEVDVVAPPTAIAAPTLVQLQPGQSATIDASQSSTTNGPQGSLTYTWTVLPSGIPVTLSSPTGATTTVTAPTGVSGTAHLSLLARDEFVLSDPVIVDVLVSTQPSTITIDPLFNTNANAGDLVQLVATARSSNPNDTLHYTWAQTSGAPVNLSSVTSAMTSFVAPAASGLYSFNVTVDNGRGDSANAGVKITIVYANPPTVVATNPIDTGIGSPFVASVTFDRAMDPSSIETPGNIFVQDSVGTIPSTTKWDAASKTAFITFGQPLTAGGSYGIHVTANVQDTSLPVPQHPPGEIFSSFTARAAQTRLFKESVPTPSSVPNSPFVVWSPSGVKVIGERYDNAGTGCASQIFWALDVNQAQGTLDLPTGILPACLADNGSVGDTIRRGVFAANRFWGIRDSTLNLVSFNGGGWTDGDGTAAVTVPQGFLFSDGNTLVNGGCVSGGAMAVRSWDSSLRAFGADVPLTSGGLCGSLSAMDGAGDGQNLYVGSVTQNDGTLHLAHLQAGSASDWFTTTANMTRPIVRMSGSVPVVVYSVGSTNALINATAVPSPSTPWYLGGAGPVNATGSVSDFDATVFGGYVYVGYILGGEVRLARAQVSSSSAAWETLYAGSTALNDDPTCTPRRVSLDHGADGLYLAWSEGCSPGPSWHVVARKVY